jgi:hypothetical protein
VSEAIMESVLRVFGVIELANLQERLSFCK